MPYAFAATSALFPEIHPIGTFYWENTKGIAASSDLFAGIETELQIDYAVVQGGHQGSTFAKLASWVATGDLSPSSIESSLAWQLSEQQNPEAWTESNYLGTFPKENIDVKIFRAP
jgi:hypothetical protein